MNPLSTSTNKHLKSIALNERLLEIMTACLMINLPTAQQLKDCTISTTGVSALDISINTMKGNIIRCFNRMFLSIPEMKLVLKYSENKFWLVSVQHLLPIFIQSLFVFFKTLGSDIEKAFKVYTHLIKGIIWDLV